MFRISKDSPAYYVTSVAKDRLPVFRTTAVKTIACSAIDEAHRVIDFLKSNGHEVSLKKLRHAKKDREYHYSLWDHHPQAKLLTSEDVVLQKVNYVHQNPVRAGLVKRAEDYRWSSVRCWQGSVREDGPLFMDIDKVTWRVSARGTASR